MANSEGWAGFGGGGLCRAGADGWPCSGGVGFWLVATVVGDKEIGTGDAVDWTISLVGVTGTGFEIPGAPGQPQAATARAKPKATAGVIRFNKGFRCVDSNAHAAAAKAGNMVSLKAASSLWG